MYVIRDGPIHRHARRFPRGKMPKTFFLCCGSVGVVLAVTGGIFLALGQQRDQTPGQQPQASTPAVTQSQITELPPQADDGKPQHHQYPYVY